MDTVSIDPLKLYSRLGSPVSPLVVDVRRDKAFAQDGAMIAAAVRPGEDLVAFAKQHAEARKAVPYDIPGAVVTHRDERCSFDALIEDFALHDGALDLLATIVRGADTGRLDLAPQCAGLVATSLGLSKRFADDHEMLAQALPVYDGLYAWCRGQCEGDREAHSWNMSA